MFGRKSETGGTNPVALPPGPAAGAHVAAAAQLGKATIPEIKPAGAPIAAAAGQPARPAAIPVEKPAEAKHRSDSYYDIKSTIFNALIDAIDLTQLGQLDREAARDEIRDIVNEIIALKDVVMSIAEQEELLEDICNDEIGRAHV